MGSESERLKELGQLIRAGYAEVGRLQLLLINAQEHKLDPAELATQIANLGRQVSAWESERRLFNRRAQLRSTICAPTNNQKG